MNSKFINVCVFAVGAAIGSAVTWKITKDRYERIVQEEIESVKEVFANRNADDTCSDDEEVVKEDSEEDYQPRQINWDELEDLDEDDDDDDDDDYSAMAEDEYLAEYARLINSYSNREGGVERVKTEPSVISPYDYGEKDGYGSFELTYYADGIIEDEDYNIVKDVEELVGPKALDSFGEYEDDAVFVRNDNLRIDIQILKDPRTYDEARSIGPSRVDD
jgi:hypothetical protein